MAYAYSLSAQRESGTRWRWFLVAVAVCLPLSLSLLGQQSPAPARVVPPEIMAATATGPAAEVVALERKFEEAMVNGDTATVAAIIAKTFSFTHGNQWATGGKPQGADNRESWLKRVAEKRYLLRDLDHVKVEMHQDVAITYGRYVNMGKPTGDNPATLLSIWFQRVYARRNGQWQFLSHRTVNGPTPAPAGVDPTASDGSPKYGVGPVFYLKNPLPAAPAPASADEAELRQLDQKVANAVVKGDVDYVRSMTTSDFSMIHGDIWTRGGISNNRDTQESMLSRVGKAYGVLDFDHIQTEMHDDIGITYGRYLAKPNTAGPGTLDRAWFSVWFERVYAKRNGRWIYLSHRTVHGPTYGPDRKAVSDK
jgi:uncharacterized protein DUF4440